MAELKAWRDVQMSHGVTVRVRLLYLQSPYMAEDCEVGACFRWGGIGSGRVWWITADPDTDQYTFSALNPYGEIPPALALADEATRESVRAVLARVNMQMWSLCRPV